MGHPHSDNNHNNGHKHHILPIKVGLIIWIALLIGTVITVLAALVDLGALNFPLAMLIATIKAMLVMLYFMGLKYDSNENRVLFGASFLFLAIFVILTFADLLFRGDVYVKGALVPQVATKSKFKNPWISSPELLAQGKESFAVQCASCHGSEGKGDGPAAAGLNPRPRNFTVADGWKNGRKVTEVFGTLTKGVGGMPAFGSMPSDDRWALSHYVQSLGSALPAATDADLAKLGIDPSKDTGGEEKAKTLPVDLAIELMSEK